MHRVTIGELTNELLPYCKLIELKYVGEAPYIRALLTNAAGFTQAYLYIIQVAEHRYSICETDDEFSQRYLPSDSSYEPFILERDFIRRMHGLERRNEEEGDDRIVKDLTYSQLLMELYKCLSYHRLINIDQIRLELPIREMGFSTFRITRALETICQEGCTVLDCLVKIQTPCTEPKLEGIRDKDLPELITRFSEIGIALDIKDKVLKGFNFEMERASKVPKGGYSSDYGERRTRDRRPR